MTSKDAVERHLKRFDAAERVCEAAEELQRGEEGVRAEELRAKKKLEEALREWRKWK